MGRPTATARPTRPTATAQPIRPTVQPNRPTTQGKDTTKDDGNGTPGYIFARTCAAGAEIENAAECRAACNQLQLDINEKLMKNGRPCYKNGRGQCAQKGTIGNKAMKICKK